MSINIEVSSSIVSVRKKIISDIRIEQQKNQRCNEALSTDKLVAPTKHSNEKVGKMKRQSGDPAQKKNTKKKETSSRKLKKYEKRYKYLEKVCHEFITPRDNRNNSTLETLLKTNDSKATKSSVSTLVRLTEEVWKLEQEVNAFLSSGSSRQLSDYDSNYIADDDDEVIDFFLKLNKVKNRLLDEFDLNLSNQGATNDSLHVADDSQVEFQKSWNVSSSGSLDEPCDTDVERTTTVESALSWLDEDEQTIDVLTEEILMDLKKSSLEIIVNNFDETQQINSLNTAPVLSDIPKILPSFLRKSLSLREKPPASLLLRKKYKRLDIDFSVHELSAIRETDSDVSRSQTTLAILELPSPSGCQ